MDITFEQYQQIQQYLDNEMTPEDIPAFELSLETDPSLKEHYLFEKQLRDGLQRLQDDAGLENFQYTPQKKGDSPLDDPQFMKALIENAGKSFTDRQNGDSAKVSGMPFKEIHTNKGTETGAKIIPMGAMIKLAIAACILLAVSATVFFTFNNKPGSTDIAGNNDNIIDTSGTTKQQDQIAQGHGKDTSNNIRHDEESTLASLFKQFFKKDDVPADPPRLLAYVLDDYSGNRYKTLQQLDIENLPASKDVNGSEAEDRRVNELAHYYKGIAHLMQKGNPAVAVSNLAWTADSTNDAELKIKARWFLALALLKVNEKEKAKTELIKVAKNEHTGTYKKEAQELLQALKK